MLTSARVPGGPVSEDLPASPCISQHLPASPGISLHLRQDLFRRTCLIWHLPLMAHFPVWYFPRYVQVLNAEEDESEDEEEPLPIDWMLAGTNFVTLLSKDLLAQTLQRTGEVLAKVSCEWG